MILPSLNRRQHALSLYSETLLELIASNQSKYTRAKKTGSTTDLIARTLENDKVCAKMIADLTDEARASFHVLSSSPFMSWRWDHALRLLHALGIESPYIAVQQLLALGLVVMSRANGPEGTTIDPITRLDIHDETPPAAMPWIAVSVRTLATDDSVPPPPLVARDPLGAWRAADGWEWPMRLAVLWQLAWITPIKRTQQNVLFKKDRERLTTHPLLSAQTLDTLATIPDAGILSYQLAILQGWLDATSDEQSPTTSLLEGWPSDFSSVLLQCAQGIFSVDAWNELGERTPVGAFSTDVASARYLAMYGLSRLPEATGASLHEIAAWIEKSHVAWNGKGELAGPLRVEKDRSALCRDWVRSALLGPIYQCGLLEVADVTAGDAVLRLSPLGRAFFGQAPLPDPAPVFPQSLFVQPNHQVIAYRQALTIKTLVQLLLFTEPRSSGAALTFEITPTSVYHGLEAGLDAPQMLSLLKDNSGRDLPPGVEQSILTWSEKRERLSIYQDCSLFEFETEDDLKHALARGVVGIQVTPRILLIEDAQASFALVRITASRDYRLDPQPCVDIGPEGTILRVDPEKSDLMLESELLRFADPLPSMGKDARRLFIVTKNSIERAFEQGFNHDSLETWFKLRTGKEPSASVKLLLRAAGGLRLGARSILVLHADSPLVADGLMQHPQTCDYIVERLGPSALAVDPSKINAFREVLNNLGIDLTLPQSSENHSPNVDQQHADHKTP